jgi:hypothetical protein
MGAAEQQGLQETQGLLRSKSQREEYFKKDAKAKEMGDKVQSLTGSGAEQEQVYDLAAQVMEKIAKESNGDPAKMQKLLDEAQKNPQAFYDRYFSAEQKAKVREVANKIEKKGAVGPAPH